MMVNPLQFNTVKMCEKESEKGGKKRLMSDANKAETRDKLLATRGLRGGQQGVCMPE